MHRGLLFLWLFLWLLAGGVARAEIDLELAAGIAELRHVVGTWDVTTEFLAPDGTVRRSVDGSYRFEWVVEDRLVSGVSHLPALGPPTAVLLYVRPSTGEIEMDSVAADGVLFRMRGPLGGNVRQSDPFSTAEGESVLRFTRSGVTEDRFVSRMHYSSDGGETWWPGNRQVFVRAD